MENISSIRFGRERGIVWVCDVRGSSSALNNDEYADAVEEYLPRLLWIGEQIVESAGGEFIKWTGDGFLAWFKCELERNMGREASAVFDAAWNLSLTNNITNLGVKTPKRFHIRHGISWEPDALILYVNRKSKYETKDILGRNIVQAFRCSGLDVAFPHIITIKKLKNALSQAGSEDHTFVELNLSDNDKLKYFKGEKRSAQHLVGSSSLRSSTSSTPLSSKKYKKIKNPAILTERRRKTLRDYLNRLYSGPDWSQDIVKEQFNLMSSQKKYSADLIIDMLSGHCDRINLPLPQKNRHTKRKANH